VAAVAQGDETVFHADQEVIGGDEDGRPGPLTETLIEPGHDLGRILEEAGQVAELGDHPGHVDGRSHALAGDVADEDGQARAWQGKVVVQISAHLQGGQGLGPDGEERVGCLGQRLGQEAFLDGGGDGHLLLGPLLGQIGLVVAGVVDGDGHLTAEGLEEQEIVGVEELLFPGVDDLGHPDELVLIDKRSGQQGAGGKAGDLVGSGEEAFVFLGVLHQDALAVLGAPASHTLAHLEFDRLL